MAFVLLGIWFVTCENKEGIMDIEKLKKGEKKKLYKHAISIIFNNMYEIVEEYQCDYE